MADKDKSSSGPTHPATPVVTLIVIALVLGAIVMRVDMFLSGDAPASGFLRQLWLFLNGEASFADVIGYTGSSFLSVFFSVLKILSLVVSVVLLWFLLSSYRKLKNINTKIKESLKPPKEVEAAIAAGGEGVPARYVNPKWERVLKHINSENSSDWKLAILEADIILDEMLDKMGYHGDTMGEKLKQVEPSDFLTLNSAWEAHKIRNQIAHEGADFALSRREADRVIALFKEVFEEFKFI